ncbi:MAG: HlyD family type I secretion periplasmic adaptor subunit [Hyphomicrobiaceae bacterium]
MNPTASPAAAMPTGLAAAKPTPTFSVGWHIMAGILAMVLLVFVVGGWAAMASLASAVVAHGTVVVERNVKKVQHLDGGIVAAIDVKEGDRVKAGQVVVRLDDTQTRAELGVIQSQLIELAGRRVRLIAERDGLTAIVFPADFDAMGTEAPGVRKGETRLFQENLRTREAQKLQLTYRVTQLEEETGGLKAQRDSKASEIALIRKELAQVVDLQRRQLTSITRVYALERQLARLVGEHGALVAQIARTAGQISEIKLQIIAIDQTARTDAQKELRAAEARISELSERQTAARDRLSRIEIRAPQDGFVHELAVHTIGGVVTPASPIMSIVPVDERLTIEVRVSPSDRDQLAIGQEARLRFTAFNYRVTPEGKGRLIRIGADITTDPKSGQNYYVGSIEVEPTVKTHDAELRLVPGMPVEVFLTTGERTPISYILKPVRDQLERAFREK